MKYFTNKDKGRTSELHSVWHFVITTTWRRLIPMQYKNSRFYKLQVDNSNSMTKQRKLQSKVQYWYSHTIYTAACGFRLYVTSIASHQRCSRAGRFRERHLHLYHTDNPLHHIYVYQRRSRERSAGECTQCLRWYHTDNCMFSCLFKNSA